MFAALASLLLFANVELTTSPALAGEPFLIDVENKTEYAAWTGLIFSLNGITCENHWGELLCLPYHLHGFPLLTPMDHWVSTIPLPPEFSGFEFWVQAACGFAERGPMYSEVHHIVIR